MEGFEKESTGDLDLVRVNRRRCKRNCELLAVIEDLALQFTPEMPNKRLGRYLTGFPREQDLSQRQGYDISTLAEKKVQHGKQLTNCFSMPMIVPSILFSCKEFSDTVNAHGLV